MDAIYTAHASATGGREGHARTDDGKVDVTLAPPKELGGNGNGTNPEQLFAAGYSACFLGAVKFVARQEKLTVPDDAKVSAAIGIGKIEGGFLIKADLEVHIPGLTKAQVEDLVAKAHHVCPYSNATRGNIELTTTVV